MGVPITILIHLIQLPIYNSSISTLCDWTVVPSKLLRCEFHPGVVHVTGQQFTAHAVSHGILVYSLYSLVAALLVFLIIRISS